MRAVVLGLVGVLLAAGGAQALGGEYQGKGGEGAWQLYAKITPSKQGSYKVNLQATNATCASMADGIGTLEGDILSVEGDCSLKISVKGQYLRVKEGSNCAAWHGASCSFDGALRQTE